MSAILTQVERERPDPSAVAGIHPGDEFFSIHKITDRRASQVLALANYRFPRGDSVASRNAMAFAKVWGLMSADSAGFADLTQLTGGRSTVIFGKYTINLARSVGDVNGAVRFINTASLVTPDETGNTLGKGVFTTQALYQGECIAKGDALLVFDPFPTSLQLAPARPVREPEHFLQRFSPRRYKITPERGKRTSEVGDDQQPLHDLDVLVARNAEEQIQYDQTGKVIMYKGEKRKESDVRYGKLTRFGDSIAQGVLSGLIDLSSLVTRVEGLVKRGTQIDVKSAELKFIGPVGYGSNLKVYQWLTEVMSANEERLSCSEGKLREGSLRLVTACSTEIGAVVESRFLVGLTSVN